MELIESIKDTIGKRVNSAFSGTFILVWIGFNWRLIFALFSFDKNFTLYDKLDWIESYFKTYDKYDTLIYPILITFASYIAYQLFNTITYAIATLVNLRLKPWVLRWIKKIMIVPRDTYDKLETTYNELNTKYREEKKQFLDSENLLKEVNNDNSKLQASVNNLKNEITQKENQISNFNDKKNEYVISATKQYGDTIIDLQREVVQLEKTKENSLLFIETKNSFDGMWRIEIMMGENNFPKHEWVGHFNNLNRGYGGVFTVKARDVLKDIKILEYDNNIYKITYAEIDKAGILNNFYLFKTNGDLYNGISTSHSVNNKPHSIVLTKITTTPTNGTT
jgi:uncharacterized membrane-anchored protein YhcB (DUF1043 family)